MKKTFTLFSLLFLFAYSGNILIAQIDIPYNFTTYSQNFNTLASTGTSSTLPSGWYLNETGSAANTTYTAGTGSGNTGDTYSFGPAGDTERAFGGLRSNNCIPTIGAEIAFNAGAGKILTKINIQYIGEQWRLGFAGRVDRLDFQYSTNATSLTTGTWTDFNELDFTAPTTTGTAGALDGNSSANQVAVVGNITGLNIVNGGKLWIRWNEFDATNSDDGLGIDNFLIGSITLGVELIDFSLETYLKHNFLNWKTASEANTSHFEIERTTEASLFKGIGKVLAAGNSSQERSYTFTDEKPVKGTNYYRLKMIDNDGTYRYSNVVSAYFGKNDSGLIITPNLVHSSLKISFEAPVENGRILIYNLDGKLVSSYLLAEGIDVLRVDVSDLVSGQYVIQYQSDQGSETVRFVKE